MTRKLREFPLEPQPPTERCMAEVNCIGMHERNWRERRYGPTDTMRCTRDAVVEIDGRVYCRLHGGHLALDMLLDGRLVRGGTGVP